jgi:hypothetical protein
MAELVDLLDGKQAGALIPNTNEVTLVPACVPKVCSTLPLGTENPFRSNFEGVFAFFGKPNFNFSKVQNFGKALLSQSPQFQILYFLA